MIKLNWDASWCPTTTKGGISVVAQNFPGKAVVGGLNIQVWFEDVERLDAQAILAIWRIWRLTQILIMLLDKSRATVHIGGIYQQCGTSSMLCDLGEMSCG